MKKDNAYDSIIAQVNSRYAIPSGLIKAIASVESEFEARFISNSGKIGLMGLYPPVARQNLPGTPWSELYDNDLRNAEVSIEIAANLLRKLFQILDNPNMWDVVRMYGRLNLSEGDYVNKVYKAYFDYSQREGQPYDISPNEVPGVFIGKQEF